jgi:hypothetical protein
MDTNIDNYIKYYNYVLDNMTKIESSGSKLVLSKMKNINLDEISISDVRKLCEYVEFIKISEDIKVAFYHEWYRYFR